ncbi:MAG: alkyl sulfatase BDS1-like metallo-beta-lactamase superfamily hydrolase, partial [Paracoccaceae bacterium]
EHDGRVSWSVRNIFNGYLGWFGGDATQLTPLAPAERSAALVETMGGFDQVVLLIETAIAERRYQWAAELASEALGLKDSKHVRALKADAFRALAYASENPNDRHFYLTQAGELVGEIRVAQPELKSDSLAFAKSLPIGEVLASLPVNLNAEKSLDRDTRVLFEFSDTGERYGVHVRKGVAELLRGEALNSWESSDIQVKTTTGTLVEVLMQARGVPGALASGDIKLGGGVWDVPAFASFLLLFKQD